MVTNKAAHFAGTMAMVKAKFSAVTFVNGRIAQLTMPRKRFVQLDYFF